jgi:hypothetical protein
LTYQTVTENVISQADFQQFDRAMTRRHELATEIVDAALEFVNTEGEMEFMHIKTVELTQDQVDNLINKCVAYKTNLGW